MAINPYKKYPQCLEVLIKSEGNRQIITKGPKNKREREVVTNISEETKSKGGHVLVPRQLLY